MRRGTDAPKLAELTTVGATPGFALLSLTRFTVFHMRLPAVALQDDVLPDEPLRRRNRDGEPVCTPAPEREPRLDLFR